MTTYDDYDAADDDGTDDDDSDAAEDGGDDDDDDDDAGSFTPFYVLVQVSSFQATAHGRALKEATVAKRSAPPSNCPRACSSGHNPLTSAGHRQVEWLKRTAVYWLEA